MDDKISSEARQFNDNHLALDGIEGFLKIQTQLKEIAGLMEISYEREIEEKVLKIKSTDNEREILSIELIRLKNQFLFCYRTFETKLNYLTKANIYALNRNNFIVFANNSRGLIEHAASISYQLKKGQQCISNLTTINSIDEARNKLKEYHDHLNKIFYGTRFFKQEGLVDAIGVMSLIENYLAKELNGARLFYDFLCDFVHPNFGSNILVTSGNSAEGIIDPLFNEKKHIVQQILNIINAVYGYLEEKSSEFSRIGIKIDNYIKKSLEGNIPLSDIFSVSNKKFTGDGKSKASAILFFGAYTHHDHLELQYELLKTKFKIEENDLTEQSVGAIDDDYCYDVHSTSKGEIWFKIPRL